MHNKFALLWSSFSSVFTSESIPSDWCSMCVMAAYAVHLAMYTNYIKLQPMGCTVNSLSDEQNIVSFDQNDFVVSLYWTRPLCYNSDKYSDQSELYYHSFDVYVCTCPYNLVIACSSVPMNTSKCYCYFAFSKNQ